MAIEPIYMSDGEVDPISHEPLPPRNVYGVKPPKPDWEIEVCAWLCVAGMVWVLWRLG